jgi:CRP-like cAMP-binding protein
MNIFKNLHLELSKKFDLEKITLNNASLKRIYKLQKRSKKDNQILYNELQNLPCFQKILKNNENGELMYSNIIKRMEIKIIKGGEPLYRHRENITNMSFILEGRIVVYKKPKEYKIKKNKKNKFRFIDKIINALENSLSSHINKIPDYFVNKGESYGFYDMKKQKREVLTEAASNFCIVGELSLNDYLVIFEKTEFLLKQDILDFLSGLKIFENVDFDFFDNIYNKITKKKYKKNEFVCKKNDQSDNLIIIKKGDFKLYFYSKIKFFNFYDLSSFNKGEVISSGNTKKNLNYQINNNYDENIEYHLINMGKGEVFGDIEFTYQIPNYFFNLQCDMDNSETLEIPINELFFFSSEELKQQIRFVTNEKIQLYINRIEEIKNVNLKMQNKQNQYKNLILLKIKKSKGKLSDKEKKNSLNQSNNKKLRIQYTRKNISISPDKNNKKSESSNPSTNVSTKNLKKISQYPQLIEFHKISNNERSFNKIKPNLMPKIQRINSCKNVMEHGLFKNKLIKNKKFLRSVIFEKNKTNFPNCFEINKHFVLNNNTSILSKSLKSIFMNNSDKFKSFKIEK